MRKFITLSQKFTVPALFLVCAIICNPVLAIAPVLDLDADDSNVVGFGYFSTLVIGATTTAITGDDVLITDSDSNKISRAVITIINPEPGDRLDQNDLEGQLTYDPSSTDTQLIVTGTGPLEKYETALSSITFSKGDDSSHHLRLISVIVEDIMGQSSNTAVTAIEIQLQQSFIPGYIYASVRNAVSSVSISGALVSLSNNDGSGFILSVYESADLYILEVITAPHVLFTVQASFPGYEANSVDNITASTSNDPSNPNQIYLNVSEADADVVPDGQLNAGDFLVASRIVLELKTATTEELTHGDMNGDGQITLSDLILIMQAIQAAP